MYVSAPETDEDYKRNMTQRTLSIGAAVLQDFGMMDLEYFAQFEKITTSDLVFDGSGQMILSILLLAP
eukprot:CAMPEP_0172449722 /NCGR_PEP_ID=MMETSP1065-20121228/8351_1 /TAXON_ID=265537 /ORGANISM="Amphiprora paludosa, Strain CCMP125" /LENGTH=67 /DNA_ID=CAMNT_0013201449 /DNA_START=1543 /DNA_END=1746 /DNA_ORIENTATION=+